MPEVLHVARIHPEYGNAIVSSQGRTDRVFEETRVLYTDPAFLEMFTFPLVKGSTASALARIASL